MENRSWPTSKIFLAGLAILFMGYLSFYFQTDLLPLMDPDEPRYGEAAREMIETEEWINPQLNYENRWDKPVLFYWSVALVYKLAGVTVASARFVPAFFAMFSALLIFAWLIRRGRPRQGFISALILSTMLIFVVIGRLVITDMMLCFFVSLSLLSGYEAIKSGRSLPLYLCYISMGISTLVKGPVGIVIPLLVFFVFLIYERKLSFILNKKHLVGWILLLGVCLPWYILQTTHQGVEYLEYFFIKHHLARVISDEMKHSQPFYYYLPVILLGSFPWLFFIPQAIAGVKREWTNDWIRFLLIWFLVVLVLFSISRAKIPTYILSLFIPISIFIASVWDRLFNQKLSTSITISFGFLIAIALIYGWWFPQFWEQTTGQSDLDLKWSLLSMIYVLGGMGVFIWLKKSRYLFLMMILFFICFGAIHLFNLSSMMGQMRSLKAFAEVIPNNAPAYFFELDKPSLIFYLERRVDHITTVPELKNVLAKSEKVYCVMRESTYESIAYELPRTKVIKHVWDKVLVTNAE